MWFVGVNSTRSYFGLRLGACSLAPAPQTLTLARPLQGVVSARFHQRLRRELQVDNNAVCQSQLSLASLAGLRMTQLVFDYQLLFGYLEALNIRNQAEVLRRSHCGGQRWRHATRGGGPPPAA